MRELTDEEIKAIVEAEAEDEGEIKAALYDAVRELVQRNCDLTTTNDGQTQLIREMRAEILCLRERLKALRMQDERN
jgi:hypothetical protein